MDPLSDVLSLLKPQSYLTAGFDAGGEWSVRFDDQNGQIKCYAVTSGACLLCVEGVDGTTAVRAGDCFVLPSGRPFVLCSATEVPAASADAVFALPRQDGVVVLNGGGDVFLAGSRFKVDGRHSELLLRTLPPILHVRAEGDQEALRWSIDRMREELRANRPGASLVAHHLAHMMLVQALRFFLVEASAQGIGWFFALADPKISAAIGAMHQAPAHRWTLRELAGKAGMSRSVFAQRFREKAGETPIAYLTRWRMMLAADKLVTTSAPLSQTAQSLGYESDNAFNTAFKRVMGFSPRRYARAKASPPTAV